MPRENEPDLLQRVIHGFFGAIVGALFGLLASLGAEEMFTTFAIGGAAIGLLLALVFGDRALRWMAALARWM